MVQPQTSTTRTNYTTKPHLTGYKFRRGHRFTFFHTAKLAEKKYPLLKSGRERQNIRPGLFSSISTLPKKLGGILKIECYSVNRRLIEKKWTDSI